MHQALAPVRHHVGLGRAPGGQRVGPLGGATQVEALDAGLDHRAADDAGGDGRHLTRRRRHHRLVEEPASPSRPRPSCSDAWPATEQPQRQQVGVGAPLGDVHDPIREHGGVVRVGPPRAPPGSRPRAGSRAPRPSGPVPSISRSARASQPVPRAVSPRRIRTSPNQKAHRTARLAVVGVDPERGTPAPMPPRCRRPGPPGARRWPDARDLRPPATRRRPRARTPHATSGGRTPPGRAQRRRSRRTGSPRIGPELTT